jgi:hypothetical protein
MDATVDLGRLDRHKILNHRIAVSIREQKRITERKDEILVGVELCPHIRSGKRFLRSSNLSNHSAPNVG